MSDNAPQPAGRKRRDLATYDLSGLKHNGQKKCPECGTFVGPKLGTGASGKPCNGKIGDDPCTYHWTRQGSKRVKLKAEALEKHKQAAMATAKNTPVSTSQARESFQNLQIKAST